MAITIGAPATERYSGFNDDWTGINKEGPADGGGSITSVEMWARSNIKDCKVATFINVIDLTFSTRDTEIIGAVTAGSKQTFAGLDMDVITGDYIGIYFSENPSASLSMDTEGGEGYWTVNADCIPCSEQEFTAFATGRTLSLYGTGTVAGGAYYHGLEVQGEGELALCDVGSHPLRMRKGGVTYGIELVALDDPNASAVRVKTGAGIEAIRKYT